VLWYNGVYLLLKRVSAFAVVPGSVVGAIPPVIGWCAAGGVATEARILEVAFFFFLWQIPHFWLLLLLFGKDYEEAGLPTLTQTFAGDQLRRITFVWILAVAATGLVLAARQGFPVPWNLIALVASLWLVLSSFTILRQKDDRRATVSSFVRINLYAAAMMVLLMGSALAL
jgi:protoheme IX farnesyltransferase